MLVYIKWDASFMLCLTLVCPLLLTLLTAVRNNVDCAGTTGPMMHLTDWRQLSYQAEPHCFDCAGLLLGV